MITYNPKANKDYICDCCDQEIPRGVRYILMPNRQCNNKLKRARWHEKCFWDAHPWHEKHKLSEVDSRRFIEQHFNNNLQLELLQAGVKQTCN